MIPPYSKPDTLTHYRCIRKHNPHANLVTTSIKMINIIIVIAVNITIKSLRLPFISPARNEARLTSLSTRRSLDSMVFIASETLAVSSTSSTSATFVVLVPFLPGQGQFKGCAQSTNPHLLLHP